MEAMRYRVAITEAAAAALERKMNNVFCVLSRRSMDSDKSHLILSDGATFSSIHTVLINLDYTSYESY